MKGVSGQQHAPAAIYLRERPGTHFTGGRVGPRTGLDGRKISSPPRFDPGLSSHSQSLYRLSYPAHTHKYYTKAKLQYNTPILIWHNLVSTACSLAQLFVDIYTVNIQEQNNNSRSIKVTNTGFCILNS